ncbi:hypothetical protein Hbl1158_00695 [Halobaculum sp. CBA1158]|uniref:hypothetical protein n=1 Tax=Halobaculum sp. CBA1158 TaxID=2904243 RepID=UPI001F1C2AC8|nr:hypothetical protein [Halobaculum sp. CBA1158]UIO99925.1 hypothetical protein Hbl1158_00695 [Halobaculum sp. CBA1158]
MPPSLASPPPATLQSSAALGSPTGIASTYSAVFAPELFVLLCGLIALGYEWRRASRRSLAGLAARIGVLGVGWGVAFAVYQGLPRLLAAAPAWTTDATGSVGLGAGLLVIRGWWRRAGWGAVVPEYALVLVAVTVPHLVITPVWDVSSHVLYAVVPAGVLTLVDRRAAPLVVVALGMVVARPLAGAHTWGESIGGLALGVAALAVYVSVGGFDDPSRADTSSRRP